ncbi:monocarboxylate transporter 7-like [Lytechinus variegatus]|uniref:monocarboxylate transporter 7-like n=1 Tax=Lytechinus variegatus TaxID=7654 RepID=UPI001BB2346A|nr:monocarboxylate transporter 7-like [Lytechinus variegatus]
MATATSMFYWGYAIVLSKFVIFFIDTGIAKSFGVLIPTMVKRLDTNYATVGLICSMPSTLMYLLSPLVKLFLTETNTRVVAISGGLLCGTCIAACAFFTNVVAIGVSLTLSGLGLSMSFIPIHLALNDFFPEKYVLMNTICLYGYTAGSMLLPILMEKSLEAYGYYGAFLILGGVAYNSMACATTLRKVPTRSTSNEAQDHITSNDRKCVSRAKPLPEETPLFRQIQVEDEEEEHEEGVPEQSGLIQSKKCRIKEREIPLELQSTCIRTFFQACKGSCGLFREPFFASTIPIQFLQAYTSYSWMLFLVPHTEQLGIPSSKAVYLSTIGGIGGIIGRTVFVVFLGKGVNAFAVYIPVGCVCTATFLLDFVSSDYRSRVVLAFLQGFSFFIEDTMLSTLCKEAVFDDMNTATALTTVAFWTGMGATAAGIFTGYLFDITQSFTKVFIILGITHAFKVGHLFIVAIILFKRKR